MQGRGYRDVQFMHWIWKEVQESAEELRNKATKKARDKLTAVKTRIFEIYDKLLEEERAGDGRQHGEAWNLVNEISVRKKSEAGQISGVTAEDSYKV